MRRQSEFSCVSPADLLLPSEQAEKVKAATNTTAKKKGKAAAKEDDFGLNFGE